MKIAVIHGSPRRGNTYALARRVMDRLSERGNFEFSEFFLPKDMPAFCTGCMNCFMKGEQLCPHRKYIEPILDKMLEADGLILGSPSYVLQVSGGMKAFLDHLGYIFLPHRPRPEMLQKKALIISTTAGAGTGSAMKTMATSLRFWGVPKILKLGVAMRALDFGEMKPSAREKAFARTDRAANAFYRTLTSGRRYGYSLYIRAMAAFVKLLIRSYPEGNLDREYWKEQGWLTGKGPLSR